MPRTPASSRPRLAALLSAWLLVLIALPTLLAAPAGAAELIGTSPSEGAVVTPDLREVTVTFTEPVGVQGEAELVGPDGEPLAADIFAHGALLSFVPEEPLEVGEHRATWRVVDSGGLVSAGGVAFTVRQAAEAATGEADSAGVAAAHRVATAIWYVALLGSTGLAFFTCLIARRLPRVTLIRLGRVSVVVTILSGVLLAVAERIWLTGDDLWAFLEPAVWFASFSGGVGTAVVGAGVLTLWAWIPLLQSSPEAPPGRAAVGISVAAGVAALSVPAFSGHSRAEGAWSLAVAADVAHLAAAGFWLGGLVGLAIVLSGATDERASALVEVVRRFSLAAIGSVAIVALSGVVLASQIAERVVPRPDESEWDALLVGKVVLVALVLGIAAHNVFRLVPRMARGDVGRLRRAVVAEGALIVAALGVTGVLVTATPAVDLAAAPADTVPATSAADPETPGDVSPWAPVVVNETWGGVSAMFTVTPTADGAGIDVTLNDEEGAVRTSSPPVVGAVPLGEGEPTEITLSPSAPGAHVGRLPFDRGVGAEVTLTVVVDGHERVTRAHVLPVD